MRQYKKHNKISAVMVGTIMFTEVLSLDPKYDKLQHFH